MHKIKKRAPAAVKRPALYNLIEDYSEFDPPGNVWVCATTEAEDIAVHARILSESYAVPLEEMQTILSAGGVYVYPQEGLLVTRGAVACRLDRTGMSPKLTWGLDVEQYAEAEQLRHAYGLTLEEVAWRVFQRTLAPDGRLVETSGVDEFARLHAITVAQARKLIEQGGILETGGDVLACQIVNGQPSVARFNQAQYAKAKELATRAGSHIIDALSEVGLSDPAMMRALKRLERPYS